MQEDEYQEFLDNYIILYEEKLKKVKIKINFLIYNLFFLQENYTQYEIDKQI